MKEITFNKGKLYFTYDDGKLYSYDINSKIFTNEKTEKVLKSYPPLLKSQIREYAMKHYNTTIQNDKDKIYPNDNVVINTIIAKFGYRWCYNSLPDLFPTEAHIAVSPLLKIDKINSALRSARKTLDCSANSNICPISSISIPANEKSQKKFFQILTKCEQNNFVNNLQTVYDILKQEEEKEKNKAYPCLIKFKELPETIYNWANRLTEKGEHFSSFPVNSILNWFLYYYERYLKFYYLVNLNNIHTCNTLIRTFEDFLNICDKLNTKPRKQNFFTEFMSLNIEYEAQRDKIENQSIKEQMTRFNFNFEDDNYIIIVPTTKQEFIYEAREQHNCVERMYLNDIIKKRATIVFVREKSNPDKSFITCEIYNNGLIGQYLKKYNASVTETSAIEFKYKYEKYLKSIMSAQ